MAKVKITDQESLAAWLKTRPAADDDILAARMALRVFPWWGGEMERPWAIQKRLTALPILRILLIKSTAHGDKDKYNRAQAVFTAYAGADHRTHAYAFAYAAAAPNAPAAAEEIASSAWHDFWVAVSVDANALQNGQDPSRLLLWPDTPLVWWASAMGETQAIWNKDPDTWVFWRRWLDGMIAGQPLPFDLLDAVASIEQNVWEAGPKAVAEAIREIEAKLAQQDALDYRVSPTTQLNAEVLVRAAIADFTFDEIRHLMRMVPFPEDIALLTDKVLLAGFLHDAKGVTKSIETMKAAFLAEGRAMQGAGGLATYLDAVLEEFSAARQLGELNVGWVIECGDILQGYTLSAEVNAEIGALGLPLKASVQKLLELTRTYFASTLLRFAPLKDIRSREETSLFALMEDLRRGLKVISSQPDDTRIGVAPEAIAVFEKLMASIDRIIQAEFLATDPVRKTTLRRDIDFMMAQVTVSMMLSWESGKRAAKGVAKGSYKVLEAVTVLDQGPGALESLIKKILDAIGK